MVTYKLFTELVKAASLAPSADNMQPWEFRKHNDTIEVFCVKPRMLPTDVNNMFSWISIGAAIQNIVVAAASYGFVSDIKYNVAELPDEPVTILYLSPGKTDSQLALWIAKRITNRNPYNTTALTSEEILCLSNSVRGLYAGIYWATGASDLDSMATMDACSSYIRLEHKPLCDELFDILRFTKKEIAATGCGLDLRSLGIPSFAIFFARMIRYRFINKTISRLGTGRMITKRLSDKLRKAGALCLVTAQKQDPASYIEAGRTMEQIWLTATAEGFSVQPYGVLPQYLTKVETEPETFLPRQAAILESHRKPFFSVFAGAEKEYPAIVLRIGRTNHLPAESSFRLKPEEIIRI